VIEFRLEAVLYLYSNFKTMRKFLVLLQLVLCTGAMAFVIDNTNDDPVFIPPSPQRVGDAAKGYEYLTTGDYVKGGIPLSLFSMAMGGQKVLLQRDGVNAKLPHAFTAVTASNGQVVVAPNCLQCHAQVFNGALVVGMGNSLADFTNESRLNNPKALGLVENMLKKSNPKGYEASAHFFEVGRTLAPYVTMPIKGVNVADRLTAILVAHRNAADLKWNGKALMEIPDVIVPTDTPPWWLLKKKNAMFYNGFGRGDFGRFLMASNLLTVADTSEASEVDSHMPDMLAYIYSIKPPKYPGTINQNLAKQGERIFEARCAKCHGSYGAKESYPNLLIPESIIGTDSLLYKSNYSHPQFVNWFNNSWFTTGNHPARLEPFNGYIAPPLDGIWATAPYLHNGSVPSLEMVLNSKLRPRYWSRNFDNPEYDAANMSWKFVVEAKPGNASVYNTDVPGYGAYGHYFGDRMSDAERKAVLEYLKTL
jgi:mono/diheme cytochrome c family protein